MNTICLRPYKLCSGDRRAQYDCTNTRGMKYRTGTSTYCLPCRPALPYPALPWPTCPNLPESYNLPLPTLPCPTCPSLPHLPCPTRLPHLLLVPILVLATRIGIQQAGRQEVRVVGQEGRSTDVRYSYGTVATYECTTYDYEYYGTVRVMDLLDCMTLRM